MPSKETVYFKDPKTGEVSPVSLWAVEARDAVKRVPWEYSKDGKSFADRPADAPDPHARPEPLPGVGHQAQPIAQPAAASKKAKNEPSADLAALKADYQKLTGKKAPGFMNTPEKLKAAIEKAKTSSASGSGESG